MNGPIRPAGRDRTAERLAASCRNPSNTFFWEGPGIGRRLHNQYGGHRSNQAQLPPGFRLSVPDHAPLAGRRWNDQTVHRTVQIKNGRVNSPGKVVGNSGLMSWPSLVLGDRPVGSRLVMGDDSRWRY